MIHLIFSRDGTVVLSRASFESWRDVQEATEGYMTSMEFEFERDLLEFLDEEYGKSRGWFTAERVKEWLASDEETLTEAP